MLYVIISTVFFVKSLFAMHIYTYREEHPMNDSGIMIPKKALKKEFTLVSLKVGDSI